MSKRVNMRGMAIAATAIAAVVALTDYTNAAGDKSHGKIMFVGSWPSSDPYGSVVVNGFNAALKTFGYDGQYRAPEQLNFDAVDEARLIESAIAEKPDGIIVTDPTPDGLNATIKKAVDAGIPLVITNSGETEVGATGAITFVGNDERQTGVVGAQRLMDLGAKDALVVTLTPGIPLVDARNNGFTDTFKGKATLGAVPPADLSDSTKIKGVIEAALVKDPKIDAVFAIGSTVIGSMLAVRSDIGDRAKSIHWSSIDLTEQIAPGIKNGDVDFAIDQQPFLQGYLPVQVLALKLQYGLDPVTHHIVTGPIIVDGKSIGQFEQFAKKGVR
jgi:simple sugar transport system substrate-binding protein